MKGSSTFSCFSVRNLQGKDRCSELAICSFAESLLDSWISFYGPFCFKPFALPVRMKCGKGAIVPVSLRLKASSTNRAQCTAETWPSLPNKRFTEEGPLSFPTARWEMAFFLSVWLYRHREGKTAPLAWKPQLSFQGTVCLSTLWAWSVHTGHVDIRKWHFSVSPKLWLSVLWVPTAVQHGGGGQKS